MIEPDMIECEDISMSSTSDAILVEANAPLSEENLSTEKDEMEKMNSEDLTSRDTPEEKADTVVPLNGFSAVHSQSKDQNNSGESEERHTEAVDDISPNESTRSELDASPTQTQQEKAEAAMSSNDYSKYHSQKGGQNEIGECEEVAAEALDEISPIVTKETKVDILPSRPSIDVDTIDTDVASSQSQRIEPEGATPIVSKSSQRFDDSLVERVLSETHERQEEDRERMNKAREQPAEIAIEENLTNSRKRQEPPGTPAKHERQKSETADEREQRINDGISDGPKKLDERRVHEIMRHDGGVVEEKKGDDDISIQREPSGSLISTNKTHRDSWKKKNYEGKRQLNKIENETATEISTDEVKKTEIQSPKRISQRHSPHVDSNHNEKPNEILMHDEKEVDHRYESPTRLVQRHSLLELNNNHNVHGAVSNSSNQHLAYGDNMRQSTLPLSPAFFVDDDESIPIPHLPPLMVPSIGPSFDTMSLQGQGQQVHLNHNGYQHQFHQRSSLLSQQQHPPVVPIPNQVTTLPGGKRKIQLHLWEYVSSRMMKPETSSFLSFRRKKGILRRSPQQSTTISEVDDTNHNNGGDNDGNNDNKNNEWTDRGTLTVSWYEGTSSLELQEHVQNSVIRKLGLRSTTKLIDFRVLDESSDSPEEIVLSPYIPNGSRLVVRFSTSDGGDVTPPKYLRFSDYDSGPPDSPSAAPSPFPTSLDLNGLGLNANQLALLGTRLNSLQVPRAESLDTKSRNKLKQKNGKKTQQTKQYQSTKKNIKEGDDEDDTTSKDSNFDANSKESNFEVASLHPEDPIQKSLREITGILLRERGARSSHVPRQEKRQVLLVLANYFGLFLLFIAVLAEIQARAPDWHQAMEQQLKNVHDCSKDKESLLTCVENGDMAGLVASIILWVSRSAATKRIFLLGFNSSNKLWTAVYESLVTSICWGFSYMFIRRGMNPDNNRDFLRRYWKDAVYGSLAGFNAAFMKQVLKNLIPQEAIEDALQERQLKFLSWLPSIG